MGQVSTKSKGGGWRICRGLQDCQSHRGGSPKSTGTGAVVYDFVGYPMASALDAGGLVWQRNNCFQGADPGSLYNKQTKRQLN